MSDVKTTERGWAGHFIAADRCKFRRNTLVEFGTKRIVVSTVGNMWTNNESQEIGYQRYYETLVFWAKYEEPYFEADIKIKKQIFFDDMPGSIHVCDWSTDYLANNVHDNMVAHVVEQIDRLEEQGG